MNINETINKTLFELVDIDSIEKNGLVNMSDIQVEDDESFTIGNGIVTHNSAINNFLNVRDNKFHGGFPLRGKPKNVYGVKNIDIIKNEELKNLLNIIGLTLGEETSNLNYGTIGILADADYDGFDITSLLLNFFSKWPELFKQQRIKIIKSPIVIAKKAKKIKRFYDLEDYKKEKLDDSWKITYNKGLGSLSLDEYDRMINDPVYDIVEWDNEALQNIIKVFGDDAELRKEWLME